MRRMARWGWFASLALACSVPNPAFDPPREKDTEPVTPGDDGDGTTIVPSTEDGDETAVSEEETGAAPGLCNNEPGEQVGLRIFDGAGNPVQRCGLVTERQCVLVRNEAEARWELADCCLTDDFCAVDTTYVVEFGPTGPAVVADPQLVALRFAFRPDDMGCSLEWVQIDEVEASLPEIPPLVYMAATSLAANQFVSVSAEPGDVLPDEVCECADVDADCCPEDLGRHSVHLTAGPSTITLDPTSPSHVEPTAQPEVAIELILVRAWQPPACEAEPEYEWIARRLWL
jgi:hypothetical protein